METNKLEKERKGGERKREIKSLKRGKRKREVREGKIEEIR